MPTVTINRKIPGSSPQEVFEQLRDIERLPELTPRVSRVEMTVAADGSVTSEWEVFLRGGIMRWIESDEFDDRNLRYGFRQLEGDLASFDGYWQVSDESGDALIELYVDFDLGMPSLAEMLNPVAARELEDAMDEVLTALTGSRDTTPESRVA